MIGWILSSPAESAKIKSRRRLLWYKLLLTNLATGFPTDFAAQDSRVMNNDLHSPSASAGGQQCWNLTNQQRLT